MSRLDMFPGSTFLNVANSGAANSKSFRKGLIARIGCPYRKNIGFRKFNPRMSFSLEASPLEKHVTGIVLRSTEKQMGRVYATRIITAMEDMEFAGLLFVECTPCDSMGRPDGAADDSIALTVFRPLPHPASIRGYFNFIDNALAKACKGKLH